MKDTNLQCFLHGKNGFAKILVRYRSEK